MRNRFVTAESWQGVGENIYRVEEGDTIEGITFKQLLGDYCQEGPKDWKYELFERCTGEDEQGFPQFVTMVRITFGNVTTMMEKADFERAVHSKARGRSNIPEIGL